MPAFEYKALDKKGKQKKGIIEGNNSRQVSQRLKEQGLIPLELDEVKAKTKKASYFTLQRNVSTNELALITRQLSTLIQAGMPLEECLRAVADQAEKQHIRSMMANVRSRVVEGYTLAEGLQDYPHVFDELFCSMVTAGEKSGHLDGVLERLADYSEKRQKLQAKLQQAMIYPVMLTLIAVSVVSFLIATVVPKMVEQFVQMGQKLPGSTQFLLSSSHFIQDYGLLMLIIILAISFAIKAALRKPDLRLKWDQKILSIPVIGKVARGLNTSKFARTLAICSSSAIPLLDGMKVAADVVGNRFVRREVLVAADMVREGSSLRKSLEQTKIFPPMMLHMIASGEQSGELEGMLTRAADNQDQDFEALVAMALGIFEPLLVVFMAGVVLFIVMATLMPILELNNLVTGG